MYNILAADDDQNVIEAYDETFREINTYSKDKLNAFFCHDGVEVMKFLEKNDPSIFYLDLIMPEIGGMEILNRIGKSFKGNIFVVSGNITPEEFKLCKEKGAYDIIYKPFVFSNIVNSLLESGFVLTT